MSGGFPNDTPRTQSDDGLRRALLGYLVQTLFVGAFLAGAGFALVVAATTARTNVLLIALAVVAVAIGAVVLRLLRTQRARLLNVWRAGELVEVTCTGWLTPSLVNAPHVLAYQGRVTRVILRKGFREGEALPALTREGWIIVRDRNGALRLGRLR